MQDIHGEGSENRLHELTPEFNEDLDEVKKMNSGYLQQAARRDAERKHDKANKEDASKN